MATNNNNFKIKTNNDLTLDTPDTPTKKIEYNNDFILDTPTKKMKFNTSHKKITLTEKSDMVKAKRLYHTQSLRQAMVGFYFGLVGAAIGLVVIIIALFYLESKAWGTLMGGIIEAVSLLIFRISDKAIARMNNFFNILGKDSNKMKAIDLTKNVKQDNLRDQLSVKLALFLIGINEENICKYTNSVCEKSTHDNIHVDKKIHSNKIKSIELDNLKDAVL